MSVYQITPNVTLIERAGWGARREHLRIGHYVPRIKRTSVHIHHTVMIDSDLTPNVWEDPAYIHVYMRRLQTARPDLGMDVPYNFVAFLTPDINGGITICEGRGEDRAAAHQKGHNTSSIGIAFAGDFENKPTEPEALAHVSSNLSQFIGWLKYKCVHKGQPRPMANLGSANPGGGRSIFFHQDHKATACPGKQLIKALADARFTMPVLGPTPGDSQ